MTKNSEQREAWENRIKGSADYFTVVRYLGPGKGYERHERPTLGEARDLAVDLAAESGKDYIIYAVSGIHDTYQEGVRAKDAKATKATQVNKAKTRKPRERL